MPCRVGSLKPPLAVRTGSQDWQSDQYRSEGLKSEAVLSDLSDNLGHPLPYEDPPKELEERPEQGGLKAAEPFVSGKLREAVALY